MTYVGPIGPHCARTGYRECTATGTQWAPPDAPCVFCAWHVRRSDYAAAHPHGICSPEQRRRERERTERDNERMAVILRALAERIER